SIPAFVNRFRETSEEPSTLAPSLHVTVGEEENAGFSKDADREEMLNARRQVDNALELAATLSEAIPGLKVKAEIFPREDHGTALLPASNRAMRVLAESETARPQAPTGN